MQLQLHYTNYTTPQLQLHHTTTTTTAALNHTTSSSCGWGDRPGDHCNHCSHSKKHSSNHLSVHQWIRSAIRDSQQPISPIGFLFLKLPPPPCAGTTGSRNSCGVGSTFPFRASSLQWGKTAPCQRTEISPSFPKKTAIWPRYHRYHVLKRENEHNLLASFHLTNCCSLRFRWHCLQRRNVL